MRNDRHLLRQIGKPRLRTVGGCLFVLAAAEIFVINHAGWNWGIIQTIEPRQYYDRYAVSVCALLLGTVAAVLVICFERRSQRKSKQNPAGLTPACRLTEPSPARRLKAQNR
jgi:hypothetical protein